MSLLLASAAVSGAVYLLVRAIAQSYTEARWAALVAFLVVSVSAALLWSEMGILALAGVAGAVMCLAIDTIGTR